MRWIKRIVLPILILLVLGGVGVYWLAISRVPKYEGEKQLTYLQSGVVVNFDNHGIPHIKGEHAEDVYHAFGYIVASERLFQMEMIRRLGKGELAEVFGERALESDIFFRTIGIRSHAVQSAADFVKDGDPETLKECKAFLSGVNAFIEENNKPLEFIAVGIPMRPFELDDLYTLAGYMAWSFSLAVQTDLLATELSLQHPDGWLEGMGLDAAELGPFGKICNTGYSGRDIEFPDFFGAAGIPAFEGSNAWAIAPSRTASGKAILCNDTHIGYGVPQVWYEAALEWPDTKFYGNFIPGIPYALVGHSYRHAWGLTMFENDDIDFYREYFTNEGEVMFDEGSYTAEKRIENIVVKNQPDTLIEVSITRHGPIVNHAIEQIKDSPPLSMRWEYTRGRNQLIQAFRGMNKASGIDEFQQHLKKIHAPGLNVVYSDSADNIAWWACARLPLRPKHVNPKAAIDGSKSANEIAAYFPFERNPQCVNPEEGFVHSANELHAAIDSTFIAGYYVPPSRSTRIASLLRARDNWDVEGMKSVLLDVVNDDDAAIATILKAILDENSSLNEFEKNCAALLEWDGNYELNTASPVLYQPLQVALLASGMRDKMSPKQFDRFCKTHWMRRLLIISLKNPTHKVWDVSTTSKVETLKDHLAEVFPKVTDQLKQTYGDEPSSWIWGEAHTWGPRHALGDIPLMGNWLSISPRPMRGSNETISQSGYYPTSATSRSARFGAQMRIIIDFESVDSSVSVAPVGQSGHRLSPHFNDQSTLYASGLFRPQYLRAQEGSRRLTFIP